MNAFRRSPLRGLALVAFLLRPGPLVACACCSEHGQRLDKTVQLTSGMLGELRLVRFASTATLYAGAGFPDTVRGLASPSSASYRLAGKHQDGRIVLELTDAAGRPGRIVLTLPSRVERFEVDPRDGQALAPGGGPLLLKEWRLKAQAQLSGIVAASHRHARATLILHGRGNACTTASDFTHWTLSVRGAGARFTLLGEIKH